MTGMIGIGLINRLKGIVTSINGLTGDVVEVAGTGITITVSGQDIIISTGSPPPASAAVFAFETALNFYPADLYATTFQSNFNFVT